ncbi:hypothetical protein HMPREF9080_01151 [Cardiobacterium valvarum F0432]|uniref:Uncharacterized protein n=1 Tax=Cardiobacterium valvarum F0432 TaxID=797473 RepID=G9ZEG6_9GAMM|nr:hypothetical protein HMPREF9080_01151 [Cardiobacterium valvarum F0432]
MAARGGVVSHFVRIAPSGINAGFAKRRHYWPRQAVWLLDPPGRTSLLPLAGEGARRADEGIPRSGINDALHLTKRRHCWLRQAAYKCWGRAKRRCCWSRQAA